MEANAKKYFFNIFFYLLQLMVDPSEEDLLWRHLHQVSQSLALPEEVDQAGDLADGDLLEQVHLDQLPDQPQHQPLLTLARVESVTVNTNHNTA